MGLLQETLALAPLDHLRPVLGEEGIKTEPRILFKEGPACLSCSVHDSKEASHMAVCGLQALSSGWDKLVFLLLEHILRGLFHVTLPIRPAFHDPTEVFFPFCSESAPEIGFIKDFFFFANLASACHSSGSSMP